MSDAPTRLSLEDSEPYVTLFSAALGRACANTTGWYFDRVTDQPDRQQVTCRVWFPDAEHDVCMWYGASYADLRGLSGERFNRFSQQIEARMADMRLEALAGWGKPLPPAPQRKAGVE